MSAEVAGYGIVVARTVDQREPLVGAAAAAGLGAARSFEQAARRLGFGDAAGEATVALTAAAERLRTLSVLTRAVEREVHALAGLQPRSIEVLMPGMASTVAIYDRFFRICRVERLTLGQSAVAALPTLRQLAGDLATAPVTRDDAALLAMHAAEFLTGGCAVTDARSPAGTGAGRPRPALPPERWALGHRVFALANGAAERALGRGTAFLLDGDGEGAAREVRRAAHGVRALTAAMELAAAMSAKAYSSAVRPYMAPPYLKFELTGGMNLDHAGYRRALDAFLAVCPEPYEQLAELGPALAAAREELLHADLNDLERHIGIAYRLVGAAPALDETELGSAVAALRQLRAHREARYGRLLRLGR